MTSKALRFEQLHLARPTAGGAVLDFALEPGSALVVVGRNGTGKSTFLQTASGLLAPQSGRACLGQESVHDMAPSLRAGHISFVTSTPPKPAGLTVADVIALGRRASGQVDAGVSLNDILEAAGILAWKDLPMDTLSDGMAQRVMVARAGVQSGHVMFLDEPTAFLDLVGKEDVLDQMAQWRGQDRIVVMATHDVEAAAAAGWTTHWLHVHPGRDAGATLYQEPLDAERAKAALRAEGGAMNAKLPQQRTSRPEGG